MNTTKTTKPRPHNGCPAVLPGRCTHDGRRTMVHLCTDFPGHTKYWHRCNCGKAWPTTPTEDDD